MNYLTNYYKNLCEDLQAKINLLESGLKKALKTGDPELLRKAALMAGARWDRAQKEARAQAGESLEATKKFGATSREAMVPAFNSERARLQAERIMKNLIAIDQQLDVEAPEARKESSKKYVTQANLEKSGLAGPDDEETMHVTPQQY
jgi:hypothetical protein